jgi:hypothetical protein
MGPNSIKRENSKLPLGVKKRTSLREDHSGSNNTPGFFGRGSVQRGPTIQELAAGTDNLTNADLLTSAEIEVNNNHGPVMPLTIRMAIAARRLSSDSARAAQTLSRQSLQTCFTPVCANYSLCASRTSI